ncbi:MBL fold metallo-hydrolase, partial [Pyxidicoccus fallax]|uniref:MBL fold metallo-hydrolase n=1 Tax=Pyxidicoccus fallax TaxID=394095 RepID=UPI001494B50B
MQTPRIIRVPILPLGMVNTHLLEGSSGCILVDAGLPGSEHKVGKALEARGWTLKDLKLIIVTHAHVDHAGAAAALRERSGAPIVAHAAERAHLLGEAPMTFCPTGWFGRAFVKNRAIHERYRPVDPDILLSDDETLDLTPFGVQGRVIHSAGHTAGSLSVQLASNEALVGDLVASGVLLGGIVRTRHAIRPPFEESPTTVAAELERLVSAGVRTFHLGHGGPLDAHEVQRHARVLRHLQPGPPHPCLLYASP